MDGYDRRRRGGAAESGMLWITLDRHALMEALNREVGSQDFADPD
jgi:hypothetical protein